ncbi:AraC family transcriptional regulator [Pseudohalioglobus lutimaris]|uniref:HTH araC/xylS-type domain-containing protein n=1 Tax=Pseudohalioglobus lutimaris TaxID=1737061 RepID=A0A2N5WZZ8_9GAMM|nr:AraC family transcriptional regulator [Pseudohalioglobus lutimaris]PLW67814.1 hypothetical protein C0039_15460 [Pseudohalioglobus lutimaris]
MDRDAKRDASAFRVLLDLSEEAKLPVDLLLADIDVDRDSIYQAYAEIYMWQELAYIERFVERGERLSLALTAASRVHITTLGTLGYAMLSSRNIVHALQVSADYHSISLWTCEVAVQSREQSIEFMILPHALPAACQHFCAIRGFASLKVWFTEMLGRDIVPTQVTCMIEAPSDAPFCAEFFGCPVQFGSDVYSISFENTLFIEPLRMSDEWACQRAEIELKGIVDQRRSSFANRVHDLVSFAPRGNHSEETVSEALGISSSTLRRRLREEDTSFREVRAETLHSLACVMLLSSTKTVDEVAEMLGFSEAASFVRSFKRREGVAPGTWRRNKRQKVS